jgi:hypothetical protein
MKILIIAIVLGPLTMIDALPAASQSGLGSGASVRLATARDSTADRETYTQKARNDMQGWQRKLHAFDEKVQARAARAHTTAGDDLNRAWTQAEAASRRLETAGSEDWESAKTSFKRASHKLDLAWRKIDPGDK